MTFNCKMVPHITLRSIARNTSLDPIFAKHEPLLAEKLATLNHEVAKVSADLKSALAAKLITKHREEGANAITDADMRRWLLPDTHPGQIKTVSRSQTAQGSYSQASRDVPREDPAWGVEGMGGPVQHRPRLAGAFAGSAHRLPPGMASEDGRGQ